MSKKFVIRRSSDGSESQPLTFEEVVDQIRKKLVTSQDEVAESPGRFFFPLHASPEFESILAQAEGGTQESPPPSRKDDFSTSESEDAKTIVSDENKHRFTEDPDTQKTSVTVMSKPLIEAPAKSDLKPPEPLPEENEWVDRETQNQKTAIFEAPPELKAKDFDLPQKRRFGIPKKSMLVMMCLVLLAYDYYFDEDEPEPSKAPTHVTMRPVRPELPSPPTDRPNPEISKKIYDRTIQEYYKQDTVVGYRKAVEGFQKALKVDPQNVRALAMLASCYINLIDSSNKDEKTFSVINKLIELSTSKQIDLVETLIAEVEFLAMLRRYDAAIQRLTEYLKVSGNVDAALYYYLGWLYSLKHEYGNARRFLSQISATSFPLPKYFYLLGWLHEQDKEYDEAIEDYKRARSYNTRHAKSILGLVRIASKQGDSKSMGRLVELLYSNPSLQSPPEYVEALIYKSKLALAEKNSDLAVKTIEIALHVDPRNEDLRLEYYSLLANSENGSHYKNLAKMYKFVLDGERLIKEQKYHEATTLILQAREAYPKSPVPLEKMGDLFFQMGQLQKAKSNYEKALAIEPKSTEIVIKVIDASIKNHDYDDALKYLAKYREFPKLKSSIDRLSGDLAFQQGFFVQAMQFYRKAMARDSVDTDVYASYANALKELDQCKDAQFFYTLAQRLDPSNGNAIIGSAKCFLKTDGVDIAVARIQDDLTRMVRARADLVAGIGEIYYLANDFVKAFQFAEQAIELDPDFPESYKIEALIYQKQIGTKKEFYKKTLEAFKAYSDRKLSDPFGYVQRFEIFLKDSNFEAANQELNRIFEISPRFPELHYRRALLLSKMGRTKEAIAELDEELKINPKLIVAMVEEGNLYIRVNGLEDALKLFTRAMQTDPANSAAKVGAGYVNYLKRQFPSAIALYMAALAIDKGNPEIYKKLGWAYRDSGDAQKAAQAFRNYLDLAPDAPDRDSYR